MCPRNVLMFWFGYPLYFSPQLPIVSELLNHLEGSKNADHTGNRHRAADAA
jgi:hypothetical protein